MLAARRVPLALTVLAGLCAARATAEVPVVELRGIVHAVSASHVVSGIEQAEAMQAPLVVLRLDTPGGLDTSMRQIIDKILASKVPVAVFVGPSGARAASAGFLITITADVAAMAPGTNIGAAHPVSGIGKMDEVMSKKVASDAAAYIRSKAAQRGRNVEMAEKAVTESRSFTEKEALELKLIDLIVKDVEALLQALDGRTVRRFDGSTTSLRLAGQRPLVVRMNWRRMVLSFVATPEILFLLLLGALAGIGAELSHPGVLLPGIFGAVCLILFLFAAQVIPVRAAGLLLILLAVVLFAAEVKVASYGLLTIGGLVAMILGAMMLVDSPLPEMRVSWSTLLPAALAMALGTFLLVRLVVQAQRRRSVTGEQGLIGRRVEAEGPLSPGGWVNIQGELWRAEADEPVGGGEPLTVTGVDGLTLKVRKGA